MSNRDGKRKVTIYLTEPERRQMRIAAAIHNMSAEQFGAVAVNALATDTPAANASKPEAPVPPAGNANHPEPVFSPVAELNNEALNKLTVTVMLEMKRRGRLRGHTHDQMYGREVHLAAPVAGDPPNSFTIALEGFEEARKRHGGNSAAGNASMPSRADLEAMDPRDREILLLGLLNVMHARKEFEAQPVKQLATCEFESFDLTPMGRVILYVRLAREWATVESNVHAQLKLVREAFARTEATLLEAQALFEWAQLNQPHKTGIGNATKAMDPKDFDDLNKRLGLAVNASSQEEAGAAAWAAGKLLKKCGLHWDDFSLSTTRTSDNAELVYNSIMRVNKTYRRIRETWEFDWDKQQKARDREERAAKKAAKAGTAPPV